MPKITKRLRTVNKRRKNNTEKSTKPTNKVTKQTKPNKQTNKVVKPVKQPVKHTMKRTKKESTGISIATSRVRNVLANSINPEIFRAMQLINQNRPREPKPTEENPDPAPIAGTPVDNIDNEEFQTLLRQAREHCNDENPTDDADEWKLSAKLIKKLSSRLSGGLEVILALFLDYLVEQYIVNGVHNCLQHNKAIIQLSHALEQTEGFTDRVTLYPYVNTMNSYRVAQEYFALVANAKQQENETPVPKYCDFEGERFTGEEWNFESYINDLCQYVKNRLSAEQTTEEETQRYLRLHVSKDFKRFFSRLVYDIVSRFGTCLRSDIQNRNVKTVSNKIISHSIETLHHNFGFDFQPVNSYITEHMVKYDSFIKEYKRRQSENSNEDVEDEVEYED